VLRSECCFVLGWWVQCHVLCQHWCCACWSWWNTQSYGARCCTGDTRLSSVNFTCRKFLSISENIARIQKKYLTAHAHTNPFNGPLSGTTQVSRSHKGKTNLHFTGARDSECQWHLLGHMQVCTSLQTDNHASTPPLSFLQAGCTSCHPTNSIKALKAQYLSAFQSYIILIICQQNLQISTNANDCSKTVQYINVYYWKSGTPWPVAYWLSCRLSTETLCWLSRVYASQILPKHMFAPHWFACVVSLVTFNSWRTVVSGIWKYDDPRLKMSHEGVRVVIISMSHEWLFVICFVVWPTTRIFYYKRLTVAQRE